MNCSAAVCTGCRECEPQIDNIPKTTCFERALMVHGHLKQALKATEELAELSAELTRYGLDQHWDRMKILEELTDVEIMLKQVKMIFGYTEDELLEMKCKKIAKLEMHLQKEEGRF